MAPNDPPLLRHAQAATGRALRIPHSSVLFAVSRRRESPCAVCTRRLCGRAVVASVFLRLRSPSLSTHECSPSRVAGAGSWVAARVGTPSSSAYRPRAARRVDRLRRRSDGDQQYRALRRAPDRDSWYGPWISAAHRAAIVVWWADGRERAAHASPHACRHVGERGSPLTRRTRDSGEGSCFAAEWGNEARRRPTRRRPTAGRAGGEEASSQLARKGGARRPWEGTTLAADWGDRLQTAYERGHGIGR
ncbi:hypothetical protein ERJ75_000449700 [Trypanosoma vivax]|nr:hypothetical protein ERJ75_000449700 [Trypanosoma vivax]